MKKHMCNIAASICLLVVGIIYFLSARSIRIFTGSSAAPISARALPFCWAFLLCALSLLLLIRSIIGFHQGKKTHEVVPKIEVTIWIRDHISVIGTFLSVFLYAYMLRSVGYLICTVIYLPVQSLLLTNSSKRNKKTYLFIALLTVVFTFVTYFIFRKLLSVPLPRGIFAF